MNRNLLHVPFDDQGIDIPLEISSVQREPEVGTPEQRRMASAVSDAILGVVYHDEYLAGRMMLLCQEYCEAYGADFHTAKFGLILSAVIGSFPITRLRQFEPIIAKHSVQSGFAENLEREHGLPSESLVREKQFADELVAYVFGDFQREMRRRGEELEKM